MVLLGLGGVALILFSLTQRPKGAPIKWSWRGGFAEGLSSRGQAIFFVGLAIAIFGLCASLGGWLQDR